MVYKNKIGASLLRIFIGFFIFKDFLIYLVNKNYLFDKSGIVSYKIYDIIIEFYKIQLFKLDFNNGLIVTFFIYSGLLFSFLFIMGIFHRISSLVLFFLLFIFKIRNIYLLDGADNVILVLLPFYFFIDTYSFSRKYNFLFSEFKNKFRLNYICDYCSSLFILAIQLQICIIYLFSGLHKLDGILWKNGTAIYYILNSKDFRFSILNTVLTYDINLVKFMSWGTIFFQLSFPVFIWLKKIKYIYILIGITIHIFIFMCMKIDNFSFIMIFSYLIFINDKYFPKNIKKMISNEE